MANKKGYNEDSIKVYEYPENIQKKPSMYIGDIGIEGCTHMIREVVDNSVDEALNGFGDKINIRISNKKGSVTVEDYGRGIPPKAIEKAFCTLHASGKFDNNEYSASAGTNGVGTTAVNALSKLFVVESVRDGKAYVQKFSNGIATTELQKTGTKKKKSGTIVYFEPNEDFMQEAKFDIDTIKEELSTKIYVLKGININLINEDTKEEFTFVSPNGLSDYIKKFNKQPICKPIKISKEINFVRKMGDHFDPDYEKTLKFNVDIEFSYDNKSHTDIISFCNSLLMRDGGIQETTFKTSLTRFFKNYIKENKLLSKKDEALLDKINGTHVTDGLVAIISIKHPDPIFQNQTKQQLKSTEIGQIAKPIADALEEFAANNPKEIKHICQKIVTCAKAYEAAIKARDAIQKKNENQFSIVSDLSKLASCISKDTSENEIFITEGRSASGTAKEARDKRTQAVYALRGKMLNTISMPTLKVLANKECADLAYILTGIKNAIDSNFQIEYLKYGKVIMLCDADVDGYHISMLGLTYIFEHMLPIISEGHMYVAIPPLYSIIEKGKKRYFIDQVEYDDYIYEKILEKYTFITVDDKPLTTVKKVTNIFKKYDELSSYISKLANNNIGLSKEILLDIFNVVIITGASAKNIHAFIKNNCSDIIFDKATQSYEGFYNDSYVFFELSKITKLFKNIFKYIEENDIPIGNIYYYDESTNVDEYSLFNIKEYDEIIEAVTPKSRTRLKGLGEMDADELRDTTLDKEKRNIYKVEIPDIEKARESMNNFMNGNSKFVEFRKNILLIKQEETV